MYSLYDQEQAGREGDRSIALIKEMTVLHSKGDLQEAKAKYNEIMSLPRSRALLEQARRLHRQTHELSPDYSLYDLSHENNSQAVCSFCIVTALVLSPIAIIGGILFGIYEIADKQGYFVLMSIFYLLTFLYIVFVIYILREFHLHGWP